MVGGGRMERGAALMARCGEGEVSRRGCWLNLECKWVVSCGGQGISEEGTKSK